MGAGEKAEARHRWSEDENTQKVYWDTPEHTLKNAGIALRLRREGRRWTQTVQTKATPHAGHLPVDGLENAAPGGRVCLEAIPDASVRSEIMDHVDGFPLQPVCETLVKVRFDWSCPPHPSGYRRRSSSFVSLRIGRRPWINLGNVRFTLVLLDRNAVSARRIANHSTCHQHKRQAISASWPDARSAQLVHDVERNGAKRGRRTCSQPELNDVVGLFSRSARSNKSGMRRFRRLGRLPKPPDHRRAAAAPADSCSK